MKDKKTQRRYGMRVKKIKSGRQTISVMELPAEAVKVTYCCIFLDYYVNKMPVFYVKIGDFSFNFTGIFIQPPFRLFVLYEKPPI